MIRYTPTTQLKIEEFKTPFELNLDPDNRWVRLSKLIPWDELAHVYHRKLEANKGREALNARWAIGAMIIKHKLNLSDRETIATIQENPYLQYFLGLDVFHAAPLFDSSLFVSLRKRMGVEEFEAFNQLIIAKSEQGKAIGKGRQPKGTSYENQQACQSTHAESGSSTTQHPQEKPSQQATAQDKDLSDTASDVPLKGKLKLDATVADIYVKYPTDLDLLNSCREWSEYLIDELYRRSERKHKPRTYRRVARKAYLSVAKKKKKSKKVVRRGLRLQLNYLKRNIASIEKMLDELGAESFPLPSKEQRYYWVLQEIYRQQQEMFDAKANRCDHRIVSLHQPYIRPIVRGKSGSHVEFGPKLGLSLVEGYTRINTLSWQAYHEGVKDFQSSVEAYGKLYGHYPELVQVDAIYGTKENRKWAQQKGIRMTVKPLGRPNKQAETPYQKRKRKKEYAQRNHIEGKIGQAKNGYRMNQVRTKLKETAQSWISCIIFVTNLIRMEKDFAQKGSNQLKNSFLDLVNYVKAWLYPSNKFKQYSACQFLARNAIK